MALGSNPASVLGSVRAVVPHPHPGPTSTPFHLGRITGPSSAHIADRVQACSRRSLAIVGQLSLLWLCSWIGHEAVAFFQLPLPGNVAGLVLMFVALLCGVVPLRFVEQGATLLLRYLPLFFVPLAVGLEAMGQLMTSCGFAILVTLIGSAAVGFAVTGRIAQYVAQAQSRHLNATRSSDVNADPNRC